MTVPLKRVDYGNVVILELRIRSDDRNFSQLSLTDDESIEWISMMRRQGRHVQRITMIDGQWSYAARHETVGHVLRGRHGKAKSSK